LSRGLARRPQPVFSQVASSSSAGAASVVASFVGLVPISAVVATVGPLVAHDGLAERNDADAVRTSAFHHINVDARHRNFLSMSLRIENLGPVLVVLADMGDHHFDDLSHVVVINSVPNGLSLPLCPQQPGGPQQSQMVRGERRADARQVRDLAHTLRIVDAGENDPKSVGFAQQPEQRHDLINLATVHSIPYL